MDLPQLGPFHLRTLLGSGGMGSVWEAVGPRCETVAIKIVHRPDPSDPWARIRFEEEVRATARLRHPGIVGVWEQGTVQDRPIVLGDQTFVPGSPWFAMDRVVGQPATVARGRAPFGWLRAVLAQLLAALAHAHARGLLHRDIKPGNVLIEDTSCRAHPGRVVLVDFGLAWAVGRTPSPADRGVVVGTAPYMAPEQFSAVDASFGPWTDLYALACLAWSLACGQPPFGLTGSFAELRVAHELHPLPPFRPKSPYPAAFDNWLSWLLEKHPARRCRRAADALAALTAITGPETDDQTPLSLAPTEGPGLRVPPRAGPSAGQSLLRLRIPPLVGRETEQATLTASLTADSKVRLILIEAPPGGGKTRLASWFAETAAEAGIADPLWWRNGDPAGPDDGLQAAILRSLSLPEDPTAAEALATTLRLPTAARSNLQSLISVGPHRFASPEARWRAWLDIQAWLQANRRRILILDDAQWSVEGLDFARWILDSGPTNPPCLMVVTHRAPLDPEWERLLSRDTTLHLPLGRLAPGHQRLAAKVLLDLDLPTTDLLLQRAEGDPFTMLQLLETWSASGWLIPGPAGLKFAAPSTAFPAGLDWWSHRLTSALPDDKPDLRRAVEVAAVLGISVDGDEWRAACRAGGLPEPETTLDTLLQAGLATAAGWAVPGSFRFSHALLRDVVLSVAARSGRLAAAQSLVLPVLAALPRASARRGQLLLEAGYPNEAVVPLQEGAIQAIRESDYLGALRALSACESALDQVGAEPGDRRRVEIGLWVARASRRRGDPAGAHAAAQAGVDRARLGGHRHQLAQGLRELSRLSWLDGAPAQAIAQAEEAHRLALLAGDPALLAWTRHDLGLLLADTGQRNGETIRLLTAAQTAFEALQEPFGQAVCLLALGTRAQRAGDPETARSHLRLARARFLTARERQEPAHAEAGLGEVARRLGHPSAATARYAAAAARFEAIGHTGSPRLRLRWAWAALEAGHGHVAAGLLEHPPAAGDEALHHLLQVWANLLRERPAGLSFSRRPTGTHLDPETREVALLLNAWVARRGHPALAAGLRAWAASSPSPSQAK